MLHSSLILVQKIIEKSCNDVAPSTGYISGLYNITLEDSVITTVICEVMRDNTSKIIIPFYVFFLIRGYFSFVSHLHKKNNCIFQNL